jgi:hypothetical protein
MSQENNMSQYTPDRWVVLEITTPKETIRKVFAGWYGGYLGSDSWKLNSGITDIREQDDLFEFDGYSGSTYFCHRDCHGMSGYMHSVLSAWRAQAEERGDVQINIIELEDIVAL